MAQSIKEYKQISRLSMGGVILCQTHIELGTEYKTGGLEVNLGKCGLVDEFLYAGWCQPVPWKGGTVEVPTEFGPIAQLQFGAELSQKLPQEPNATQTVLLYLFNLEPTTKKETEKEKIVPVQEAEKGAKGSEMKLILTLIGR